MFCRVLFICLYRLYTLDMVYIWLMNVCTWWDMGLAHQTSIAISRSYIAMPSIVTLDGRQEQQERKMFQMAVGFLIYGNHIGTAGKTKFEQIVVHLAAWHGSTRFVYGVCSVQNLFLQNCQQSVWRWRESIMICGQQRRVPKWDHSISICGYPQHRCMTVASSLEPSPSQSAKCCLVSNPYDAELDQAVNQAWSRDIINSY